MKVYVITSGSYSDYSIDRVFLNKEKAERYIKMCQNNWDEPRIEEYETDDDKQIDEITYVYDNYTKHSSISNNSLEVKIQKTNSLDDDKELVNTTWLYMPSYSNQITLTLKRVLHTNFDEETIIKKYKKVCYDIMTKVESLKDIEGWTEEMIESWLNDNVDNYLK